MQTKQFIMASWMMLLAAISVQAQVPGLPNPSATQTISQELGLGAVAVTYSRPNVKGRTIFGGLVPYGQVWRTGANSATTVAFSEDVLVQGHKLPAGTYALFTIPDATEWTVIFNKAEKQWGAYTYNAAQDVLRFTVKPVSIPEKLETFTIQFNQSTSESVVLRIAWDNTAVDIPLQADDDARITATFEKLMQAPHNENLVYFNAIQYFYMHNKNADQALGWIANAKKDVPTNPAYYLFESRFLLRKGDKKGAAKAAEAGLQLAKQLHFAEYEQLNQEALALAIQ